MVDKDVSHVVIFQSNAMKTSAIRLIFPGGKCYSSADLKDFLGKQIDVNNITV